MNKSITESSFGVRLKEARKARGLSQPELAQRVGLGQGQISKLELDQRGESTRTVQIARELGVEPLWLATGEGPREVRDSALLDEFVASISESDRATTLAVLRHVLAANAARLGKSLHERVAARLDGLAGVAAGGHKLLDSDHAKLTHMVNRQVAHARRLGEADRDPHTPND